ncbi:DUF6631 family protein [Salmonella enterica]
MADKSDDLAVLFPSCDLLVAGQSVTVHEYTLSDQLKHRQPLKILSDAFAGLLDGLPADAEIPLDSLLDVFAEHEAAVVHAVAVSCGQSADWVAGLTGPDADSLLLTWWGVNADFFTRAAVRPAMERLAKQMSQHRAGEKSAPR